MGHINKIALMGKCIICGTEDVKRVIELGYHPPADTFLKKEELKNGQRFYLLNCVLCMCCGHLQTEYIVPKEERYNEVEYSYTSSNSQIAREHWEEYCETTLQYAQIKKGEHIIEFGSNDGYLLAQFMKRGCAVTGMDPSLSMVGLSQSKGIMTIHGFLNEKNIAAATRKNGTARMIIGNNVFNHIETPNEALQVIKSALGTGGFFTLEVPYHKDLIEKFLFDTIYHEHISYFSVKSLDFLCKKNQMYIAKIEHNNYHGGSLRVYISNEQRKYNAAEVATYIAQENHSGIFDTETYQRFMEKITKDKMNVLSVIYSEKKKGKKIVAIGAAAKGNTLLNFYKLDASVLEFVTENSPYKIGKYTPGSCIPIVEDGWLLKKEVDIALILPWNIGNFLIEKIKKMNSKLQFIVPGEKEIL